MVLNKLAVICSLKDVTYADVSQIWWCLLKRGGSLIPVQVLLDLVHQRRFTQELRENLGSAGSAPKDALRLTADSGTRDLLCYLIENKFTVRRRPVENRYEEWVTPWECAPSRRLWLREPDNDCLSLEPASQTGTYEPLRFAYLRSARPEIPVRVEDAEKAPKQVQRPSPPQRVFQNPFLFYFPSEFVRELLNSLLLNDDLLASLRASELLYARLRSLESGGPEQHARE